MTGSKKIPILILNFKNYHEIEGQKGIELARSVQKVSKSFGGSIQLVVAPPQPALSLVKQNVNIPVFAQHLDFAEAGSTTGYFIPEMARSFGAQGSLLNHSEHRIDKLDTIQGLVNQLRSLQMVSVVCARTPSEVSTLARFEPDYIAIEPPELIGSGRAVSKENPSIVTDSINAAAKMSHNARVICGAGITDANDVSSALKLGAVGILVASGIIKATSWIDKITELASGFK
ncbi:MAG TPA: triose-phosphate isomerase [Nitrososphaeraceae archaeon]